MTNKELTPLTKFIHKLSRILPAESVADYIAIALTAPLWYLVCIWLVTDEEWDNYATNLETWVKIKVR